MYKIVFVVAVFAFAVQGGVEPEVSAPNGADALPAAKNGAAVENKPDDTPTTAPTPTIAPSSTETTTPMSGDASGSEICVLLVHVSSLALIAKHALL